MGPVSKTTRIERKAACRRGRADLHYKNGEGDLVVMSIEAFEQREEALKLRAKLEAAEQGRLAGAPAYTLEDSRKRLEEIYRRG